MCEKTPVAARGNEKGVPRASRGIHTPASYAIISDDETLGFHVFQVRLNAKVSSEDLDEIAFEIKSRRIEQDDIVSMYYYLPGMMPETAYWHPWAVTHSRPVFRTRILGLTTEEERRLRSKPLVLPDGSKALGTWLADDWIQNNQMTIYRNSGLSDAAYEHLLQQMIDSHRVTIYRNASGKWRVLFDADPEPTPLELKETQLDDGVAFEVSHGVDRYVVDRHGALRVYTGGELISMPEAIKPPMSATEGITEKEVQSIDGAIISFVRRSP